MAKVVALNQYLVAKVTCCFNCPFSHLSAIDWFPPKQEWVCKATGQPHRPLGAEPPQDGSPDWCPLKIRPILAKWTGPKEGE